MFMNNPIINFSTVSSIGIVCTDCSRLSPVAAVLLRYYMSRSTNASVRRIQVSNAGYNKVGLKISNRAISFLQKRGFGVSDHMKPVRIDRVWVEKKDLILSTDRFLKRNLIYDVFSTKVAEMRETVFTLPEAVGIDDKIRDPGEDRGIDIAPTFELIDKCCIKLVKILENAN